MGSVHGAEEEGSGRRAAVKLVSPELLASREARERFRQEGRLASRIAHPRCVFVLAPPGLARGVARGGLSFRLAGLALVRRSGARATRIQWALRSLLLWGPFATLLWVAADTDNRQPHLSPAVRACALSLLPIYAIVALRFPRRGPLDVLLGTWVVRR